jgi:hypothetical protein
MWIEVLENSVHVIMIVKQLLSSVFVRQYTYAFDSSFFSIIAQGILYITYRMKPEDTNSWTTIKRNCTTAGSDSLPARSDSYCLSVCLSIQSHKSETAETVTKPDKLIARALSDSICSLFASSVRSLYRPDVSGPRHDSPSKLLVGFLLNFL